MNKLNPIIGEKFGNYTVISNEVFKIKDKNKDHYRGFFKVKCTTCNTEHLIRSDILKSSQATRCRACSNREKYLNNVKNKIIDHKGYSTSHKGTGDLTKTHLLHIKYGAMKRKIEWCENEMTTEILWELLKKQNFKCALSGLEINLSKGKNIPIQINGNLNYDGWTASLDRIDSSKGYTLNNVWWVHRNINIMKNSYSVDYFLELCELITNKNKKK